MPTGSDVFAVHLTKRAQKDLLAIPTSDARWFRDALNTLAAEEDPQSAVKKLKGHEHVPIYSWRIDKYRAIFTIDNGALVIFVITVDKRSSVYRNV